MNIDQIADDVISKLTAEDVKTIKDVESVDDMVQFHHSAGRSIRNSYGLWEEDNSLTKQ